MAVTSLLLVLLEVRVVLELRWVMHVMGVLALPRLPLFSFVGQLRIVLHLVPVRNRVVFVVPILSLLHVVWVGVGGRRVGGGRERGRRRRRDSNTVDGVTVPAVPVPILRLLLPSSVVIVPPSFNPSSPVLPSSSSSSFVHTLRLLLLSPSSLPLVPAKARVHSINHLADLGGAR
jgi:hypothetical protein